jgi:hypothetical protein
MAQAPGAAPSMMGTFGSSMAGSMAGSMIGNAMFGGRGGGEAPQAAAPQAAGQPQLSAPVCQFETHQFLQCMTQTGENMEQCRNMYDMFKHCQAQASYQQQQPQYQ